MHRCWSSRPSFAAGSSLHLAHRLHGEFRLRDEVSRLAIESITLGVLAEASRRAAKASERPAPGWLQQARALVDTHFAEAIAAGRRRAAGRRPPGASRADLSPRSSDYLRAATSATCASSSRAVSWRRRARRWATSPRGRLLRSEPFFPPVQALHRASDARRILAARRTSARRAKTVPSR